MKKFAVLALLLLLAVPAQVVIGAGAAAGAGTGSGGGSTSLLTSLFSCNALFEYGETTIATGNPTIATGNPTIATGNPLISPSLVQLASPTAVGNAGFAGMLTDSMLVVLLMLSVLALLYGIGYAFSLTRLMAFVKSEYAESLANVVIIVIVMVGGFGLFNSGMVFLSGVAAGAVGTSGLTLQGGQALSTQQVYLDLCHGYNSGIISANLENYGGVVVTLFLYNVIIGFGVEAMPNGFGFVIHPFDGIQTLRVAIWTEEGMAFAIIEMGGMLILMLFTIYFLFPIFFYVGLALRTLPWTRAAGGSLIAVFIAFYIVFPALLLPFSQIVPQNPGLCGVALGSNQAPTSTLCTTEGFWAKLGSGLSNALSGLIGTTTAYFTGGSSFGTVMEGNVVEFTNEISYSVMQLIGVIISFIISYDLMEFLGDVLGAPSLQASRILSKVV